MIGVVCVLKGGFFCLIPFSGVDAMWFLEVEDLFLGQAPRWGC